MKRRCCCTIIVRLLLWLYYCRSAAVVGSVYRGCAVVFVIPTECCFKSSCLSNCTNLEESMCAFFFCRITVIMAQTRTHRSTVCCGHKGKTLMCDCCCIAAAQSRELESWRDGVIQQRHRVNIAEITIFPWSWARRHGEQSRKKEPARATLNAQRTRQGARSRPGHKLAP